MLKAWSLRRNWYRDWWRWNKDWPAIGKNRKSEIYYYLIETSKNPDMNKVKYYKEFKEEKNNEYERNSKGNMAK